MSELHGLPNFLLKPAEGALNAALAADPEALRMLAELSDRRVAVELSDFSIVVAVGIAGDRIRLGGADGAPDATVSGRLASLLAAGRSGTARGLNVAGDAEVVQGLARVMSRLPQAVWERVSRSLGDVPARGLERFAHTARETLEETRKRIETNLAEYLQYELRAVVARAEVEDFLAGADRLRADADRLAKRVERLARP